MSYQHKEWYTNPQTTRENWRYIYRIERQGCSYYYNFHLMRENARLAREAFNLAKLARKSLLERLAEHTDKHYCSSCDTIVEYVCSNCDNCEDGCCDCLTC